VRDAFSEVDTNRIIDKNVKRKVCSKHSLT